MPTFGAYEGIRKVRDRGLLTAWSARAAAAKPTAAPKFLVTVGASLPWNTGDSELVVSERFLEAAELQRRVAEGGSHWVPILDTGQVDDGPYTVTAFYPRTAGDFIEGQVALSGRRLHHVVHAVLQGLIELRDAEDRAHGALRPDSVLIGSGELARTAVVLSNPAPSHDVDTYSFGVDVRALGDLVHQLVMHRPFRLTVGLPLRASEEWTRLGKKGDAWRLFCSKLLDPRPENAVGLDDAARELPALRESGRARWAVPAAAVAVLAVGGWFAAPWLVGRFTTKPVVQKGAEAQWDPERWARLCTEYNGWFAAFSDRLTPKRRARWAKDLHLAELLAKLDAADIAVDPRKIADARGLVRTMAKRPPAGAKTPEAVRQTVAALDLIDLVAARRMLTASSWPALSHIDSLAD
ncbi:hypothetical protein HQ560_14260, partial [bacterium]|nr:hypothetical protein [bacterium]